MKIYLTHILIIAWKDLLLEARSKEVVVSVLVFSLLSIVVFNIAFDPTPRTVAMVAPGILWVALSFGGVLGLSRTFALEVESGGFTGTLLSPIARDAFFFGKVISSFMFMALVELVLVPVMVVLFDLNIPVVLFILVSALALLAVSLVGTLFAAMAINTRAREILMPVLFLPVIIPALLASVECTEILFAGNGSGDLGKWISLLGVFDAVYLIATPLCFGLVVSD